ncbi:MAG: hypothetical protein WA066_02865 [Candidatus Omnitrophota bacterium]
MSFSLYRLYRKEVLAVQTVGNLDGRYLDNKWTPTKVIFKARNENEAMKKARKFWDDGQFGMGSIIVIKVA